ncbi:TSC10 [[Candida] subhashii]|uniref:3-ketodihydrosphingosine reductase TSC10 n=1 Tax=[Candida] subhashii TaxID=561895 RepID=A0A8J5R0Z4_9ASCO|nr:TSC10 [[Candida] subhashii]KAG7664585.1 TSC10 [[Candida] subhashii]
MWFSKSNFPTEGKTALIIGASQGLGAELALQLYKKNCSIILVARTQTKLESQIQRIKQAAPESKAQFLTYIVNDASNYESCVELWKEIVEIRQLDPDIIFCCAGSSVPKLFADLTGRDIKQGVETNYYTAVYPIHAGFKAVLASNPGLKCYEYKKRQIILFSSVVGFYPFIGYLQYAPVKAALESLSIILRQELGPYNYRVSCVFPGNFMSEGFLEEQKTKPEITKKIEGPSEAIPGDVCAGMIIDQLSKGYDTVTTDFIGWVLGCSVLGVLPRQWGFFQVIVSFLFSIIAPIANWVVYRDVVAFFRKREENESEDTKKDD